MPTTLEILKNLSMGVVGIEEERYFLKYEIENALIEIICKRSKCSCQGEAEELFRAWCEDEDGELAMDRLINIIIH